MKTTRLILIATFLTFSTAGMVKAGESTGKLTNNVISLTLSQAMQVPGLVIAMYQQLDQGFLNVNRQSYTVSVYYQNRLVRITGSYNQWAMFFHNTWKIKNDYKVIERD